MKSNVPLISSLRQPFRSLLLLTLFGLITFGFMTKAVGFILVQRETEVLGSYYRSIGILENVNDPQFGVRDYRGYFRRDRIDRNQPLFRLWRPAGGGFRRHATNI
jgi:hypothetical protein